MLITEEHLRAYQENGFIFLPEYFSKAEVEVMKAALPRVFAENSPQRVMEKEGSSVRSVYGSHVGNDVFHRLSRHPRIVAPVMRILGGDVYVYQFKINAKAAFGGDVWEWHQDYIFWHKEDGMPAARAVNVIIFIDEVSEFNGPLFFIPGSHKEGMIDVPARDALSMNEAGVPESYRHSPPWITNLTARLKYSLDRETVAEMVAEHGIVAPKGSSGSVLFSHPNIIHGSPNNISPFDRVLIIITYNSTQNIPVGVVERRPEFLASHDFKPVVPLRDDALL
ncbi:MAG: phytanoyl-CoA dioxygenase family protein [Pyrinomonadaceae bacterium]|nr:phytanoyl-CoA dioxygenase family protein [Pyrinomonadaceae bacterium]